MKRRHFLTRSMALMAGPAFATGPGRATTVDGFRLPEESEPHERTFMQWPVNRTVHRDGRFLLELQRSIASVANAISRFEPVVMLMDRKHEASARRLLERGVEIWDVPTDDLWCRDSGPLFVVDARKRLAVARIVFNGWGNKQTHTADGKVAERVAARLGLPVIVATLVGEAGGVETDGDGTLLAHESCWVNPNRNRETRDVIEARLLAALGAKRMIWAPGVKGADITDFHIDALARFVKPGLVAIQLAGSASKSDPWSVASRETLSILRRATDAKGRRLEIVTVTGPTRTRIKSPDFVDSYVNYYVCNGAVIAPQFGDTAADSKARAVLSTLYPGREIVMLNIDPIGEIGGGIHCATQQQPKP